MIDYNKYTIEENSSLLSSLEKVLLKNQVIDFFNKLDNLFNRYIKNEKKVVYFDEILIIKHTQSKIDVLFHYFDNNKHREDLKSEHINTIVDEFIINYPYDMYLFLKDQPNLDFDYITRCKLKGENVLVLLNNIEYSINDIQLANPNAWNSMNHINDNIHFYLRDVLNIKGG